MMFANQCNWLDLGGMIVVFPKTIAIIDIFALSNPSHLITINLMFRMK